MGEEVDVLVIKKTQATLGKIVKKPPLTEKLLRKPPFRFLHDIVTNVINTTGYMKDVFTPEELNSENIKDKESKIKFLQKVINEVSTTTGESLAVKPGKIVAGHEADKTNILLQALAQATKSGDGENAKSKDEERAKPPEKKSTRSDRTPSRDRKPNNSKAVPEKTNSKTKTRSRSQDKPMAKKEKSSKEVKKTNSSTDEPKTKSRQSTKDKPREQHRSRKNEEVNKSPPKKEPSSPPKAVTSPEKKVQSSKENTPTHEATENHTSAVAVNGHNEVTEMGGEMQKDDGGDGDASRSRPPTSRPITSRPVTTRPFTTRPSTSTIRKSSSNDNEIQNTDEVPVAANHMITSPSHQAVDETIARPPTSFARLRSARPASARPPPPVVKSKRTVTEEPPSSLEAVNGVVNVIVENEKTNEEDDGFVTEEPPAQLEIENEPIKPSTDINVDGEHGSLVTQILESKKDLESGSQLDKNIVEIDKSMLADVTKRKERDVVLREVEKMRSNIQILTRSINPLGKMIDYAQEDVESMQKELLKWQRENQQHSQSLKRERSGLANSLEPLRVQLEELDHLIQDQTEKIGTVKSNILRNEEKIHKLLTSARS